jgi:glutamine transport system permease protein
MDAFLQSHYIKVLPALAEGLVYTLLITFAGLAIGFVIGAAAGLARLARNRALRLVAGTYVEIIRGTPMLAQIFFIYFGISDLLDVNLHKLTAAVIAIAVNAGAYIAEIVRGAVDSIDRGQTEAGRTLGLTHGQTMRFVVWPQALKRMIPPLGNQFVISLKDTSLFSVIAVGEVLYRGKQYINDTFASFEVWTMACVLYLCITIPASLLLRRMERRMQGA